MGWAGRGLQLSVLCLGLAGSLAQGQQVTNGSPRVLATSQDRIAQLTRSAQLRARRDLRQLEAEVPPDVEPAAPEPVTAELVATHSVRETTHRDDRVPLQETVAPAPVSARSQGATPRLGVAHRGAEQVRPVDAPVGRPAYRLASGRTVRRTVHRDRYQPPEVIGDPGFAGQIVDEQWVDVPPGEIIHDGQVFDGQMLGDPVIDGHLHDGHLSGGDCGCGGGSCAAGGCATGSCALGAAGGCGQCWACGLGGCWLDVFGGVQGFTGPINRGSSGSFGFHEGVNFGRPLCGGLAGQVGVRITHSNLSGSALVNDTRNQVFVTAGLFHRSYEGLQCGVAFDYLSDDWYAHLDLTQLRGEMSYSFCGRGDLGFAFRQSLSTDTIQRGVRMETYESTDVYSVFYRRRLQPCQLAEGRIYAGLTGVGDGLIGADIVLPITPSVSLDSGFTYLIPEEPADNGGTLNESWNVYVSLVFRPGCGSSLGCYRPLMRVADNGSFLVDRTAP